MRLVDATTTTTTMTNVATVRRGRRDYVLVAGYLGATSLCVLMVFWIWYAPGSCTPLRSAMDQGWYRQKSGAFVPLNLVTKYAKHFAVCASHVLPASGWCAIAPFQLHPSARAKFPRAHRVLGRVFFALGTSMIYGYWLINRRGLHFHATDFPTISQNDKMSLWIDYARLGVTFVQFEHASAAWFFYTLSRAYVAVAFRRNFTEHRIWVWRHVAAGLSVAAQRVLIGVHHALFSFLRHPGFSHGVPELQKPIFADSLIIGGALCVFYCEWCVRRSTSSSFRPKRA